MSDKEKWEQDMRAAFLNAIGMMSPLPTFLVLLLFDIGTPLTRFGLMLIPYGLVLIIATLYKMGILKVEQTKWGEEKV